MPPVKQFGDINKLKIKQPRILQGILRCVVFDPPKKDGEYLIYWPISLSGYSKYCFHTCSFNASSNEWLKEISSEAYWLDNMSIRE